MAPSLYLVAQLCTVRWLGIRRHTQLIKINMHRRITIHFEAVNNAFYVWLNGQLLGYSQDSCLPAEFDVTDIVSTEQNTLTVQVCACNPSHGRSALRLSPQSDVSICKLYTKCHPCNSHNAGTGHAVQRWQLS